MKSWIVPPQSDAVTVTSSGMARDAFCSGWDACRDAIILALSSVSVHVSETTAAIVGPNGEILVQGAVKNVIEGLIGTLGIEIEDHASLPDEIPNDYFGFAPADGTAPPR